MTWEDNIKMKVVGMGRSDRCMFTISIHCNPVIKNLNWCWL